MVSPLRAEATVNSTYPFSACGAAFCTTAWTWILPVVCVGAGDDKQVVQADRRNAEQVHRVGDAAVVEDGAGTERHHLAAAGRLVQADPVDRLGAWD